MSKAPSVKVTTPKGELQWVFINGNPKVTKRGKKKYQASIVMPTAKAQPLIDQIEDFWKEHKPAKAKRADCATVGYRPMSEKSDKVDEDGDAIYVEVPGMTEFFMSTGAEWPDGKSKEVRIYNAKARPVSLGDKKIGNGSIGELSGNMCIYDVEGNYGINLYLEAIKISKLEEYQGDDGFGEDEGDDDGWTGEDDTFEGDAPAAEEGKAKPRL